jgi:hypothetical protein
MKGRIGTSAQMVNAEGAGCTFKRDKLARRQDKIRRAVKGLDRAARKAASAFNPAPRLRGRP